MQEFQDYIRNAWLREAQEVLPKKFVDARTGSKETEEMA